jgi:hypothetical protein
MEVTMAPKSSLAPYEPWPELPYEKFAPTAYLLQMGLQAIGKLKLATPYEPEWANVALWVTSQGLTTGPIPYQSGTFTVNTNFIRHQVTCVSSWGQFSEFNLTPMSVAELVTNLFKILYDIGVDIKINLKPQEVPNPIPFDQDTKPRPYDVELVNAWWRILVSSHQVMERYHARFLGRTPPIGFMWGTFDLRDVRSINKKVSTTRANAGYLRRNAMDVAQIEVGWWIGNPAYPRPAYYSFTYPQPANIENAKIKPSAAHWEKSLGEFLLDYDDVRKSKNPESDLLAFLESSYEAGVKLAGWDSNLIGPGKPV